jgi:AraC-like DNA-binding protein
MAPKVKTINERVTKPVMGNTGVAPLIRREKLRYPELSNAQIARRVGCDPSNVHRVLKRFMGEQIHEDSLEEYQGAKADIYDVLQRRFLGSIDDADIAKAPLIARVTASAILEDKARTIRGQATSINVTALLDLVSAAKSLRDNPPTINAVSSDVESQESNAPLAVEAPE